MRTREHDSSWSGLVISLCTSLLLSACAGWPLNGNEADDAQLRRAMLQSHPGRPGYDPAAARSALRALRASSVADIADVARLRLEEMDAANDCQIKVEALKQRLGKVADIERSTAPKGD